MERYNKYKPSGIEWIGEIPEHWDCLKIKRLTNVKRGASPRPIEDPKYFDESGEFSWVRIVDVTASERYLEKTTQKLSELGASLSVKRYPGDFFLSIAGTVGKPVITKIKCCIHDGFVWFPNLQINPESLYYIFSTGLPYQGLGKWGTQLNLNTDTVGEISIPLPNRKDINEIVRFLDDKTSQIDLLIEKKKKLIELLKKERTAAINQAVTRGLDQNVKLKPSVIDWLGDIPEHWEVKKLKYLSKLISKGTTPSTVGAEVLSGGKIRFLKAENIQQSNSISFFPEFFIDVDTNNILKRSKLKENDILIVIAGATIGKVGILLEEFIPANTNQAVCFIRLKETKYVKWIWLFLQSYLIKQNISLASVQAAQPNLSMENIGNFQFLIPKYEEIEKIVQFIEIETKRIDSTISKIEKESELLQEYRTALISEVVTGKIKVI